jgi:lysine/ornithine N-monooxygenase
VTRPAIAIVGAGPYGLSLAAHLAARNIEHRIFGAPMQFWSQIAGAGGERYLKSYCFGTNISTPKSGYSFADYSAPRGLETFEPCSMADFAAYGQWFQKNNAPWVENHNVTRISNKDGAFLLALTNGEQCHASNVVIATGLSYLAQMPPVFSRLPSALVTHTSEIARFEVFRGQRVAVVGAGQSALEAAALLSEFGASPELIIRERSILWQTRVSKSRSLWRKVRSPISGLGTGPKAWTLTHFPGAMHRTPAGWRTRFVKSHLPPEGAWWLRRRVEDRVPVHAQTVVLDAFERQGQAVLRLRTGKDGREQQMVVDSVVAGTGYDLNVDRLEFLDQSLRGRIARLERAPRLSATFETSIPGLRWIGPASAMSSGPLFRFVVGAEYSARVVATCFSSRARFVP